jgi:hypothetical protein
MSKQKTAQEDAGKVASQEPIQDLTPDEEEMLGKQEARIQGAQDSFFEMVDALQVIETDKLYRPHRSLSAYAFARWDMSDSQVSHYRSAWVVLRALEDAGFDQKDWPKNEGQARALARKSLTVRLGKDKFDTKRAVGVWRSLKKSGKPITAQAILEKAKRYENGEKASQDEGEEITPLDVHKAKATARNMEGSSVSVIVRATQEQADTLNALLDSRSIVDNADGVYTLMLTTDDVESVFTRFGAFVTAQKITEGSVSFMVR